MKTRKSRILVVFATLLFALFISAIGVHAATWKCVEWTSETVKVGKYWYRSMYVFDDDNPEDTEIQIQRSSKSKKKGFKTLISGDALKLDGGFATDGTTIYYIEKNKLKAYTIKTKKKTTVKTLKTTKSGGYFNMAGVYDGKLWILCRKEAYEVPYLFSFDLNTKALKVEKKNVRCYNAVTPARYAVLSTKKRSKNGTYKTFTLLDKKTGTTKTFAKNVLPWDYAAGGMLDMYKKMGQFFIYAEFNTAKNAWQIKEYKFATDKTIVLKTLKKNQVPDMLFYNGAGVVYYLKGQSNVTEAQYKKQTVKAK